MSMTGEEIIDTVILLTEYKKTLGNAVGLANKRGKIDNLINGLRNEMSNIDITFEAGC